MTDDSDTQFTKAVAVALAKLPAVQRVVFLAICDDEDVTYAALSARLGISVRDTERAFVAALVTLATAVDR